MDKYCVVGDRGTLGDGRRIPDMDKIEHDGRRTAYRVADRGADGRTLLFVHGSGGDSCVWKAQHRLAGEHRVVSLDLSGHGGSDDVEAPPGQETLAAYVSDVAAVAKATDAEVLLGNSLGGAVIQWGIVSDTLDPDAAVLVGSGAKLAVLADLRDWLATDFDRAVAFLHQPGRFFADADERLVAASREAMHDCGRAVTERDFLTSHVFDIRDQLGEIDCPVLAIGGALDELTPPIYHEYLARQLPNGVLAIVPDAAHLVMLERPDRFNTAVTTFLAHVD